jgi:hypothetical protein
MKQTVNFYTFERVFNSSHYSNNFTYDGLKALYDYLDQCEEDFGEEIELNVCALCCDFTEYKNLKEFQHYFSDGYENMDDIKEDTTVIMIDDESFIIQNF